ncbi:sensor histidine kinase [Mucilaginibacter angelicae]|uniref:Sensor histidine kinase n=1 Tax=Mucilaginibacter angelicae TaxID=869718 RepID=A0ABV6L222_9SPHI
MKHIKAKHIIEILIHMSFWIGVYYTLRSLTSSTINMQVSHNGAIVQKINANVVSGFSVFTVGFMALLFYGNILWIFEKALRYKKTLMGIATVTGWFTLIFAANAILLGPNMKDAVPPEPPFRKITIHRNGVDALIRQNTEYFAKGNWRHAQLNILLIFLVVEGLAVAYFFLKKWARIELARNQLEAHQLSIEVKFLKSQINPHFLFNTLNNLFSMAQEKGNDELADGISKLSGMMRYMIYDSNAGGVPLNKEIAYLEDCITLNKLRYADDEVKVLFDQPANAGNVTVAPMLFIPFVENAFKHGVSIGHTSDINIAIVLSDHRLIFTCINPKYSAIKKMEDEKSGIGLENVKRRLDLLYPGKHTLQISEAEGKYIVKLEIDLE